MKIYRYEHRESHIGPCYLESPVHEALTHIPEEITHLTWENDENLQHIASDPEFKAAFGSRKDLAKWFAGFHADLISAEFELVTYDVPVHAVHRAYRGHQVAYNGLRASGRTVLAPLPS